MQELTSPDDPSGPAHALFAVADYVPLAALMIAAQAMIAAGLWYVESEPVAAVGWVAASATACLLVIKGARAREAASRSAADRSELMHEIALHKRIFETSLDLLLVTDRHGQFIDVSPSCKAILGYEPHEMIGKFGIDFIYPDDLGLIRTEMRLARRGRETRNFESRYMHKDGHPVTLNWAGVWSEAEGRHFFIGRDTTLQKNLESAERAANELLAAVIDASPVAIVCLAADRDRTVTVWSRSAEQMFGYTAAEVLGRPYPLVPTGADPQAEYDDLFERASAGGALRDIRVTRQRKDGTLVDISFDAAALIGPDGVTSIAYALTDITERNRLEQQLRHSQKMDAIGQLTGGVAHDFNNLLTVITGTIDILAEAVADRPELVAVADLISEAANRGAELTSRLLAFARKQPLQPRRTDSNEAVTEAAKLLQPTLGEQIDIEWKLEESTWPALVDPAQLVTALLNLAVNARDAMPKGGKLTFETGNATFDEFDARNNGDVAPGYYVMFAVSDSGTGIPASVRDKVFEPFFTTKEVGKGTGLGLSMVYGFVKQSGGHIKMYSEEGIGTTFKIYVPRAVPESDADDDPAGDIQHSGTETILVVEDDPTVRKSVVTQLESLGYKTVTAANAAEALALVDAGTAFDLMFTDVVMPGPMDGIQLAAEASNRRPSIKVLFTSGYTMSSMVHHGRIEPDVLLLAKPYRKSNLARMVRKALSATKFTLENDQFRGVDELQ